MSYVSLSCVTHLLLLWQALRWMFLKVSTLYDAFWKCRFVWPVANWRCTTFWSYFVHPRTFISLTPRFARLFFIIFGNCVVVSSTPTWLPISISWRVRAVFPFVRGHSSVQFTCFALLCTECRGTRKECSVSLRVAQTTHIRGVVSLPLKYCCNSLSLRGFVAYFCIETQCRQFVFERFCRTFFLMKLGLLNFFSWQCLSEIEGVSTATVLPLPWCHTHDLRCMWKISSHKTSGIFWLTIATKAFAGSFLSIIYLCIGTFFFRVSTFHMSTHPQTGSLWSTVNLGSYRKFFNVRFIVLKVRFSSRSGAKNKGHFLMVKFFQGRKPGARYPFLKVPLWAFSRSALFPPRSCRF